MPYGGGYSSLSSKNNRLNQYDFIKNSKKGAILIEFAFAVPVLFSLIYYIQDLARYKQIQQRMQFAAQEIASNLQNIARVKSSTITSNDMLNAIRAANLSFCPGMTQYSQNDYWSGAPLGYIPVTRIHYVKGTGSSSAEIKWLCRCHTWDVNQYRVAQQTTKEYNKNETKIKSWIGAPYDIYPDLTINEGEVKIIVEHKLHAYNDKDGKILGFYFLNPVTSNTGEQVLFNSIVIFSPVPGAFSETPPK